MVMFLPPTNPNQTHDDPTYLRVSRLNHATKNVQVRRKTAIIPIPLKIQKDRRAGRMVVAPIRNAQISVMDVTRIETPACCITRPMKSSTDNVGSSPAAIFKRCYLIGNKSAESDFGLLKISNPLLFNCDYWRVS